LPNLLLQTQFHRLHIVILDNGYNLPKVIDCTQLLQEHVYGEKDISGVQSRNLPELVRRFVEDASMCIYIDPDGIMYQ